MVKFNPRLSQTLSKVFLSKNHVTRAYKNSVMPLLTKKKKEMITQNVTLSNAWEGGNTKVEQINF